MVRRKPETHFPLQSLLLTLLCPISYLFYMISLNDMLGRHIQSLKVLSGPVSYYNLTSSSRLSTAPFMARPVTQGPDVGLLQFQDTSLPLPARPNASCFGGWERGWDGVTHFASSFGFAASLAHTKGIRPSVSCLRDMCGFSGVPYMRGLNRVQPPSATSATHKL